MFYTLLKSILFQLPPEKAHHLGIKFIKCGFSTPLFRDLLTNSLNYQSDMLKQTIMGMEFKNPVGLAAGFDKYCHFYQHFPNLGFGFGEIGTITPLAQEGNPAPRLFRDLPNKAILNRMGFNNGGMQKCIDQLSKHPLTTIPLCINIGKNKITPNENAVEDYQNLIKGLSAFTSFFTINISSPNTPGLRNLQNKEELRKLLLPVMETNANTLNKPVALKIAPDITEGECNDIIDVCLEAKVSAIITTNTTTDKTTISSHLQSEQGGVSGKPVKEASNKILRQVALKLEGRIPIIGVGGIFTPEDAFEKIWLGASLVEVYTGYIYEGPFLVKKINKGLEKILKTKGYSNISQAIGKGLHQ